MRAKIESLYELDKNTLRGTADAKDVFINFLSAVESGEMRAASKDADGTWKVDPVVKKGILIGFRLGDIVDMSVGTLKFADKETFPPLAPDLVALGSRIVPGGSTIRRGVYIGKQVTCMPPMYINVGAYVDDGTMVDSHALVGSCAQIGKRVHLSAAVQIGGVLEPIGQTPVVIEDDVMVGGNCGIYEGTVVRSGAVVGTGTILNASTPVYDLVNEVELRATADKPLEIPANAVVVPGSRPARGDYAKSLGLSLAAAVIVKYRDANTSARVALEEALR